MTAERIAEPSPALARLCDAAVVPFAGFTLLANATVAIGGGLDDLLLATALCATLAIGWMVWRRRTRTRPVGNGEDTQIREATPAPDVDQETRIALLAAAGIALGVYLLTESLAAFSACAGMTAAGALLRCWRMTPAQRPASTPRGAATVLIALSLLCAVATAVAHRGDADDSFYVNLVVAAVDRPDAPLLAGDTLHGLDGVPMSLPVFEVLSWELLQAGVARVTGIDALTLVQVVVPPLIALLIPLAYARLLALLLPSRWLWALGVVVAALLLVGDGQAGHGDFALLRLHQGKSVLLHVALPLISAYGILFALRPGPRRFVLFMSAQIAAVGLSSSGLWLAPAVGGLALLGASRWPTGRADARRTAGRLAIGLLASAHAVGLALLLRAETRSAFEQAVHRVDSLAWTGEELVAHASTLVLGDGPFAWLALFCLPAALAAAPGLLMRRWAAVVLVAFFGLFWNPATAPFVAGHVTGPETYFRVFWLLPLPVLVATVLTAPLEWPIAGRAGAWSWRVAACLVLVALALLGLPQTRTLSADNDVRIARPGWKVPPGEMEIAVLVSRYAGAGESVLAPVRVSRWLPLLHHHPAPLMVREMHLDRLHDRLGAEELERRLLLTHLVGGERFGDGGVELLAEAIDDYPLEVVCLGGPGLSRPELRRVLIDSALEVRERGPDYEIWARGTMRE